MPTRKLAKLVLIYLLIANSIGLIKSLAEMIMERNGTNSIRNENFNPAPQSAPSKSTPIRTPYSNGLIRINATNYDLFRFANIDIAFYADTLNKRISQDSVTTYTSNGIMLGKWTQSGVTNIFSTGNDIFFTINAAVKSKIPGTPFPMDRSYTFTVDYNFNTNTIYFDN